MVQSSRKNLKFENILISPSLPVWNGSEFEAPVDGIYAFELNLNIKGYSNNCRYRISVRIDGKSVDFIQDNTTTLNTNSDPGITNYHRLIHELKTGQKLAFYDYVHHGNSIRDYTYNSCYTNGKSHRCSWISGRLMKRL